MNRIFLLILCCVFSNKKKEKCEETSKLLDIYFHVLVLEGAKMSVLQHYENNVNKEKCVPASPREYGDAFPVLA